MQYIKDHAPKLPRDEVVTCMSTLRDRFVFKAEQARKGQNFPTKIMNYVATDDRSFQSLVDDMVEVSRNMDILTIDYNKKDEK